MVSSSRNEQDRDQELKFNERRLNCDSARKSDGDGTVIGSGIMGSSDVVSSLE